MLWRFLRNLAFALILFLFVFVVQQLPWSATQPVEEYVAYVLTTDLNVQPVWARLEGAVENLGFGDLLQALPRISLGR